jgi:UPF0755 protein
MKKVIIIVIIILILAAVVAGWLFKMVFLGQSGSGTVKDFTIESGQGVHQIVKNLKDQHLIENGYILETYIWLKKAGNKILAGEHRIRDNWSIHQLVNALISGSALENERLIKILEGWDLRDISQYLERENVCTAKDFLDLVGYPAVDYNYNKELPRPKDFSHDYEFLNEKPGNLSLEGYLFPDTYRIFKTATAEQVVRKMLDNFDKKITSEMLGVIEQKDQKLFDILTLASIIEKEAKTFEDKKRVAGVYYNRLKAGMALQADPTVNYINDKATDRPSLDDLESDSPYNTYKYPGLPMGPICNPGLDSIMAAIYPEVNDYYYFINTPEGEMIFAKTFEEHKKNRVKYFND